MGRYWDMGMCMNMDKDWDLDWDFWVMTWIGIWVWIGREGEMKSIGEGLGR